MDETDLLLRQVTEAISTIVNDTALSEQRVKANAFVEEVKNCENAKVGLSLAYKMITGNCSDHELLRFSVKSFGFQLIEVIVKGKWNSMDNDTKNETKTLLENLVRMSTSGTYEANKSVIHGISKCVVECIKREWPQNWQGLLPLLLSFPKSECVLYILWRIAEDVGVFYLPQNAQRRREILSELVANLNSIMSYISGCLTAEDINVCLTALQTLTGFLEWCQLDENLFNFLCCLLSAQLENPALSTKIKLLVCNCLIVCLNRKGLKAEDRKVFLALFSEANINHVLTALRVSLASLDTGQLSDDHWNSCKRLSYVLSLMGQVTIVQGFEVISSVSTWTLYLNAQAHLFTCNNQVLNSISLQFWRDFTRTEQIRSHMLSKELLARLTDAIPVKLVKTEVLESNMGFEFDDQDDYEAFFYKFRAEVLEFLRTLTCNYESFCFEFSVTLLQNLLSKPNENNKSEWEVMAMIFDSVCNKINDTKAFSTNGLKAFSAILNVMFTSNDPDITSSQLSCLSALFVFLPFSSDNELLNNMLKKVFALAVFNPDGQSKQTRSKEVKNLRRHACSAFVKLCRIYSQTLMPLFPTLKSHIDNISVTDDDMSQMEKCALNEGLLLISNEFDTIESQKLLVQDILSPLLWFTNCNFTTEMFITFVGLHVKVEENEKYGHNRANLMYAVNSVLGVLKRVSRKAALLPEIYVFIKPLYSLIACLNSMWKPENQLLVHDDYRQLVFAPLTESGKLQLLEMPISSSSNESVTTKTPCQRSQTFLWALHENCFAILNVALTVLSPEIYGDMMNFSSFLVDSEFLPDAKLRLILKLFVRPLICSAPVDQSFYESNVAAMFQSFLSSLFRRINAQWEIFRDRTTCSPGKEEKDLMEMEVIEEQLCRLLSRDFVDCMAHILIQHPRSNEAMDDVGDTEMSENTEKACADGVLTELGSFLLARLPDVVVIMNSVLLTWMDTVTSLKATAINSVVFRRLISDGTIRTADEAMFLFQQILTALNYFGEHEQNQAILLHLMLTLFEGVVMKLGIVDVKQKLALVTNRTLAEWDNFQERWMKPPPAGKPAVPEKRKKDALKNLLGSIIGKNVGQLYKRNMEEIRSLKPATFFSKIQRKPSVLDEDLKLCNLFDA